MHQLVDIVSKNGNLLLSIPMKGDGTIDSLEVKFLKGMSEWMKINGEAIYGSRPWKVFGEGPTNVESGMFNENKIKFTYEDIRFTKVDNSIYIFIMGLPQKNHIIVNSLGANSKLSDDINILNISLLGSDEKVNWSQNANGLNIELSDFSNFKYALVLKVETINN
ncbi:MAG: alpha-L-fucosidase [Ignavibacteriales bacterium]|nr:alpha-L-fucosidase [Ignavibacteriales bacterium]